MNQNPCSLGADILKVGRDISKQRYNGAGGANGMKKNRDRKEGSRERGGGHRVRCAI